MLPFSLPGKNPLQETSKTVIIYTLVFVGLFLARAGWYYGVDRRLASLLGRFGFLASGRLKEQELSTSQVERSVPAIAA